jgi:hypothetical protein
VKLITNNSSIRERTITTERPPLVVEISANFLRIEVCRKISAADLYGGNFGFLDWDPYFFSFKQLLSCTHKAEWTLFQTNYFSENLVAPDIEPGPLDL